MDRWVTTSASDGGTPRRTVRFIHTPAIRLGDEEEVYLDLATVSGSSVGLPANTIYIRPSDGRAFRTV